MLQETRGQMAVHKKSKTGRSKEAGYGIKNEKPQ